MVVHFRHGVYIVIVIVLLYVIIRHSVLSFAYTVSKEKSGFIVVVGEVSR